MPENSVHAEMGPWADQKTWVYLLVIPIWVLKLKQRRDCWKRRHIHCTEDGDKSLWSVSFYAGPESHKEITIFQFREVDRERPYCSERRLKEIKEREGEARKNKPRGKKPRSQVMPPEVNSTGPPNPSMSVLSAASS